MERELVKRAKANNLKKVNHAVMDLSQVETRSGVLQKEFILCHTCYAM